AFLDNISVGNLNISALLAKLSGFPRKISAILFFSHQNNTKGRDYTSSPALQIIPKPCWIGRNDKEDFPYALMNLHGFFQRRGKHRSLGRLIRAQYHARHEWQQKHRI